ncbi:MAG: hypothetical protein ACK5JS_08955 [Mangrovibacterium sp.]
MEATLENAIKSIQSLYPEINLHIFVNSVSFISDMIKVSNFSPNDVRITCSISKDDRALLGVISRNQKKLGESYPIASVNDPVKKVNFYTSACFEGCDILDPEGYTIVVTNAKLQHTQLDVATEITQICGRIRDSKYKNQILHIYTNATKKITFIEHKNTLQIEKQAATEFIEEFNARTPTFRETLIDPLQSSRQSVGISRYLSMNTESAKLELDSKMMQVDLYHLWLDQLVCSNATEGLAAEYAHFPFEVTKQWHNESDTKIPSKRSSFKKSFK